MREILFRGILSPPPFGEERENSAACLVGVPDTPVSRMRITSTLCLGPSLLKLRNMEPLLKLLQENAALKPAQIAAMLNLPEADVLAKIKAYEADEVILGYRTIVNEE